MAEFEDKLVLFARVLTFCQNFKAEWNPSVVVILGSRVSTDEGPFGLIVHQLADVERECEASGKQFKTLKSESVVVGQERLDVKSRRRGKSLFK